jgi:glyoxylase-like metal-dependent hydrolase (beta-lactamase superfamily II)
MNGTLPHYEVFALRYATVDRTRQENFIGVVDDHDGPMPLDYYVWVVRLGSRIWLVDTGFNREAAVARKRVFLRCPVDGLANLGIAPEAIGDVIVTHLHYDHAGNLRRLPGARIHIQERELHYATGCQMCRPLFRLPYALEDVLDVVRGVYGDRVSFYRGDKELAPGLQLLLIGGHTDGLQAVRVHTSRGWVVLASDACHFYENMSKAQPYPTVFHLGDMLDGWDKVHAFASSPDHVVPGHDPLVLHRYPRCGNPDNEIVDLTQQPSPLA